MAPRCPVVMMSGHGTVETAVEATRLGAFDFVEKPLSLAKLLRTVERALDSGRNRRQAGRSLAPTLIAPVGKSRVMHALREQVQQVAPHETPVVIVGESGTGREAFARYIHSISPRSSGPFVQLVATGMTDDGAGAALHGTEDAAGIHAGLLEQAAGGVLFINGLDDLPQKAQGLLVAALETRTVTRVGSAEPHPLNVRILEFGDTAPAQRGQWFGVAAGTAFTAQRDHADGATVARLCAGRAGTAALLRRSPGG